MICTKLKYLNSYEDVFCRVINLIKEIDLLKLENGRYELDGENIVLIRTNYETDYEKNRIWESHLKYMDIHITLSGKEKILYSNINNMKVIADYDENNDFTKYNGNAEAEIISETDTAVIFLPEDVHLTGKMVEDRKENVEKVIIKVKL